MPRTQPTLSSERVVMAWAGERVRGQIPGPQRGLEPEATQELGRLSCSLALRGGAVRVGERRGSGKRVSGGPLEPWDGRSISRQQDGRDVGNRHHPRAADPRAADPRLHP